MYSKSSYKRHSSPSLYFCLFVWGYLDYWRLGIGLRTVYVSHRLSTIIGFEVHQQSSLGTFLKFSILITLLNIQQKLCCRISKIIYFLILISNKRFKLKKICYLTQWYWKISFSSGALDESWGCEYFPRRSGWEWMLFLDKPKRNIAFRAKSYQKKSEFWKIF